MNDVLWWTTGIVVGIYIAVVLFVLCCSAGADDDRNYL